MPRTRAKSAAPQREHFHYLPIVRGIRSLTPGRRRLFSKETPSRDSSPPLYLGDHLFGLGNILW